MDLKIPSVVVLSSLLVMGGCAARRAVPASGAPVGGSEFDRHLRQGILLSSRGDDESAVREFTIAQALNPKSARAHNLCGIAHFRMQNYTQAEVQFLTAISLDASNADACNNLGSVYFAQHQYATAEKMYRKAMDLSPNSVSPYYSLGTLLLIQGRAEEGTRFLEKGIKLDPRFLVAHHALEVDVPTPGAGWSETYFVYAKLYARSGRLDQAFEFLRKAEKAGFHDWKRIMEDRDFESLRGDPRLREFPAAGEPRGAGGSPR